MQSPSGHTLYFVADLTHIICIYSRFYPSPLILLIFKKKKFSAGAEKKEKKKHFFLSILVKTNGRNMIRDKGKNI